jgi:hypothetical protein
MLCLTTGPETVELANYGLKPLKPGAKISLSHFKLFFLGILTQQ